MIKSKETAGAIFVLVSSAVWGLFPVITQQWANSIPPLFFGGVLSILAALGVLSLMVYRKKSNELLNRKAYFYFFMISIFIVVLPSILFFIGASLTSGLNASVLMLSEIVFTLIATPFFGERNTGQKYVGALGIFAGAVFVLYDGTGISFTFGDALIVLSTASFPLGNFYSKKALFVVSPSVLIVARYIIGGFILCVFSAMFEADRLTSSLIFDNWPVLLFLGLFVLPVTKISFYEGMKRLDISKSITLVMTYPFFSLLLLVFWYGVSISVYQYIGVAIMIAGTFFAVKRKSVDSSITKYHHT